MTDNASTVKSEGEKDPYRDLSEIAADHYFLKNFPLSTSVATSLPQKRFLFVSQKVQNRRADH